ncbi:translation initiation factor IF-2 [uncultured Oscillibacter sp.]|uniref:translation initiation factor IF-2 n=1 Tax=uncultured Oscillibacter sp. TaxID=876091 RepID=UPI0025E85AFD|nr:translation initiation factor IF-2 [uncultured Oscillibacter sp.]
MRAEKAVAMKILAALDRIVEMQRTIRHGPDPCVATGLVFLSYYYQELPESVARRLTELCPDALARIPDATSFQGTEKERQGVAASIASDAAFAQVIRAANIYRKKLGLGLLGADGRPEQTEGGSSSE